MKKKGLLIVLSGPSGSGKGTICKRFLEKNEKVGLSISATTRAPRDGEEDGTHYFFIDKPKFEEMIEKQELLEYVHVFDNYYGTPKKYVEDKIESGDDVILEIEIEGAMNIKVSYPDAVLIFVLPPTIEELRRRICSRGTETMEQIDKRLDRSIREISEIEQYSYFIVNDDLEYSVKELEAIVLAEKNRVSRYTKQIHELYQDYENGMKEYSK